MYTATLINVQADPNFPEISISFIQFNKDGVPFGEIDEARALTQEQLISYCKEKVNKLNENETQLQGMTDLISNPPLGDLDITDSEEEIKNKAFHEALNKLQVLKSQLGLGIIQADDAEYVSALQKAKTLKQQI